jgi:2-succinyl-5-enolpyruvyl-6-hydroxy-3-cyclohexene-1-carboxylate synthase
MTANPDTHVLLRAFADELARCGMRAACTSPGSRNAPLLLALARDPHLTCYSHIDERAAGFFALGWAKRLGVPAAVACTSGTAAAELLPAVVEAHEARVPLLVLSADRPAELRENGAGQAIDQLKLYGSAAKWFFEVELPPAADAAALRWIRTLACRAYATTLEGRPGAVHLNFPLREPLVAQVAELPPDESGREGGAPFVLRATALPGRTTKEGIVRFLDAVRDARRGVVVAGRHERRFEIPGHEGETSLGQAASAFAAAMGWPLLADPMSGARRGRAAVAHYDALLRADTLTAGVHPDLVVRVGDLPVSKPLRTWLAGLDDTQQIALDAEDAWQDPDAVVSMSLSLDPVETLAALGEASGAVDAGAAEADWLARWRAADESAAEAIRTALAGDGLSEPALAAELGTLLPADATLFTASSMPIRDIETVWPARDDPPRVLCNRGANGIDGTVSSAFGAAAAAAHVGLGEQVVLLIGDVALAHDIGGLLASTRLGLKLTIVLINNEGGGIFDFLPVSQAPLAREDDLYTRHVATPTGLDFARAADLYGFEHERVETPTAFRAALERALERQGSGIIEVASDRERNVAVHRRMWDAVGAALSR